MNDRFGDFTADDVRVLIAQNPLAWVCSATGLEASQLPLVGEYDQDGRLVRLIGHFARSNPLHGQLRACPDALLLFSGPDAYVSPEHAGVRNWAPTWNYANLRIQSSIRVDEALTDYALDVLTSAMEAGRPAPWGRDAISDRYERMSRAIVGFRADVISIAGRFKYSQDETDEVYETILARLPSPEVTRWMRRLNRQR
jgi:transcriptional regulator